ncbi:MAG: aminoacetone oxidase family FAD-binding enzyme [Planctomycetota bacterium]
MGDEPRGVNRPLRIVVIGAGAAGLVAAAEASLRMGQGNEGLPSEIVLLEKNRKTGVKILMSGGTRCNITQDTDARGIAAAFGKSGRFLQKSVGAFPPEDVVRMFHRLGVATKVEETGKIFPKSDRALHVRDALQQQAIAAGVQIRLKASVGEVVPTAAGWRVGLSADGSDGEGSIECDRVIITAGGRSWPGCGTTGDAYDWLRGLGHTIVRPRPALVPLVGGSDWTKSLSGLTLDDCIASVYRRDDWKGVPSKKRKPLVSRRSSWLFTHFGFSGPAAMDVSGAMTAAKQFEETRCVVDFLPEIAVESLADELRSGGGRRRVSTVLAQWLPNRFAASLAEQSGGDITLAELSKQQFERLVAAMKYSELPVHGTRGFEKAEVTAGGVAVGEVDSRTMQSRLHRGLYIAGEVLDVDGWIGGYNFQAAFSTGRAAGIAAADSLTEFGR